MTARVAAVVVRDPDGGTVVTVLIDGQEVTVDDEFVVDAGAGMDWSDWVAHRDWCLAQAVLHSPDGPGVVAEAFNDPPGGCYLNKPGGVGWLPPTDPGEEERSRA